MQAIPKIVVTGGPCAGKTTFMAKASDWCIAHGFTPIIVPEAATTFITSGHNPLLSGFQAGVMSFVLATEASYELMAAQYPNPVLLCDRGACDQKAYMEEGAFRALAVQNGTSAEELLQSRYAAAIFLDSAANGAEEFYSSESNKTRYESLESARALNARTLDAWMGIPHLFVVENIKGRSFADKIDYAITCLGRILGVPEPIEAERKFLLRGFELSVLPKNAVAADIVQTYLVGTPGVTERVRARGINNQWMYIHTIKEYRAPGVSVERERIIDEREYQNFLIRQDPTRWVVHKKRYCFVFEGQYCELDVFGGHLEGTVLLEIETAREDRHASPPRYLSIIREVTEEKGFSNYELARKVA